MSQRLAQRVLIVGWDAADWRVLQPLLDQGHMPALSRLMGAGAHGNLATIQPALSPMLWTSIATGKRADRHGIHGFLEPIPDGSGVRPVSSTSRQGKALWNIAHQNGLKSLSVSWYASHPAEPVHGVVVSDRFFARQKGDPIAGSVSPEALMPHLAPYRVGTDEITAQDLAAFIPRLGEIQPGDARPVHALTQILAQCASVQAVATALMLDHDDWDLATVFYDGLDHLGHGFMPYHPPHRTGVDQREFDLFNHVIAGGYRFFDMMLESLLAHAGANTTVLLVSDHGFKTGQLRPQGHGWEKPVDWHRQFGVAVASGPGIAADQQLYGATVLDVTPTALHLLGLPVGLDMDGRPWLEITTGPTPGDPAPAVQTVMSWDAVDGDAGLHNDERREDPADALAMIQQLVDLGYVAPLGDDVQTTLKQTLRDNRINLALSLFDSRRSAQAQPVIDGLLGEDPEDPLVLCIAARAALLQRRPDDARGLARRAQAAGGRTDTVLNLLAEAAMAQRDYAEATDLYRALIAQDQADTRSPAAHCRLGDALACLDDGPGAQAAYRQALDLDPDHAPAWIGLSKRALAQGDAAEAVTHATKAVSLVHAYPQGHYHLGQALLAAGRREDAAVAYAVCASLAPGMLACIEPLAQLKQELGHDDARSFALQAAALRSRARQAHSAREDAAHPPPQDAAHALHR